MKKLVTISREYGSGGRLIGSVLAKKIDVPLYDKELINMAAEESGLSKDIISQAEMQAQNGFSYILASAMCYSDLATFHMSLNERTFMAQFDVVTEIAGQGEGVIVGRCADFVLRDNTDVTNVFIYANEEDKARRCVEVYGLSEDAVRSEIVKRDKARANYYNYHTGRKWGDRSNYNLCINSSYMTEEETADLIVEYLRKRTYHEAENKGEDHD